jgi:shikimate dehydrogenase
MYPRVEESPLPHELLRAGLVVMDIVYNPLETRLLKATRETGGMAIPGTEMLLHQAVEQERIWLGVDAPLGVMREALLRGLARVP